ncbi:YkgB family protein [Pseudomonas sp. LB1P83]
MNYLVNILGRSGLLKRDLDYHLLRAAMVIIFVWFGYDKWFEAEIRDLIPLISNGPLISWTLPVLGVRGTSFLLGASEWTFGLLLLLGFWNKKLGVLGALGSCATFIGTLTILPFAPGAWHPEAGGFPAMTIVSAFLLKDLVLLVVSVYLLKQDVARVIDARALPITENPNKSSNVLKAGRS